MIDHTNHTIVTTNVTTTGHLDRVVTGVVAEEILAACDESGGGGGMAGGEGQTGLANPAIHLLRGLRHRNLAAIRHAAQVRIG